MTIHTYIHTFSPLGRVTPLPNQEIQVTSHQHEPRTVGPTTPTATTTTDRRPPQPGTPCRGQRHLRRRAPPHQGDCEERTRAVGTSAAAPPNQVGREGKIGTVGSPAAAPPNQVVREDKTDAEDTPAAALPNQVCRDERTGALDSPAAAGLEAERGKATGAENTNAGNEPGTPRGSTPVTAAAHAADVNTPLATTYKSKGVCPVNITKRTDVHGPRRVLPEVTGGKGRMNLGAVPATGGVNPAASGATTEGAGPKGRSKNTQTESTRLHNRGPQGGTRTYRHPRSHSHPPRSHPRPRSGRRATPRGRGKEQRAPGPTNPRQPVVTTDRSPSPHDSPTPREHGKEQRALGPTLSRQSGGGTSDRSPFPYDSPRSRSIRARACRSPQDNRPATAAEYGGDTVPSVFRIQGRGTAHLQQRGHATRQNSKDPQHPRAMRNTSTPRRTGREGMPHFPRCLHLPSPGTLIRLLGDNLLTHYKLTASEPVKVATLLGATAVLHPDRVTLTDWLRILVREQALIVDSTDMAREAFYAIQVRPGEEWRNVASRLVRHFRTVVVDPDRPHASEATYFWRYVTERQLYELFERVIDAVLTNPLDRLSLNSLLHDAVARVKREVRSLSIAFHDPLGIDMQKRGQVTENVFSEFVERLALRSSTYSSAPVLPRNARPNPSKAVTQLFSLDEVRQLFSSRGQLTALEPAHSRVHRG